MSVSGRLLPVTTGRDRPNADRRFRPGANQRRRLVPVATAVPGPQPANPPIDRPHQEPRKQTPRSEVTVGNSEGFTLNPLGYRMTAPMAPDRQRANR